MKNIQDNPQQWRKVWRGGETFGHNLTSGREKRGEKSVGKQHDERSERRKSSGGLSQVMYH